MPTYEAIWLVAAPPSPEVIESSEMSLRFALEKGSGWAVIQARLHPRQVDESHEFRVFPNALLHTMIYRLAQSGLEFPDDLRAATINRAAPIDDAFADGEACLLTVNDTKILGYRWKFERYEAFVTVYQGKWVAALLPSGQTRQMITE